MPRGNLIVTLSGLPVKTAEFYQLVAHHVRIGSQPTAHSVHRISHHIVPISLLQIDNMKRKAILTCSGRSQFNVFLRRTGQSVVCIHTDFYVKQIGLVSLFTQQVHGYCTVHSSRNQRCYIHIFLFLTANIPPASQMPNTLFRVYLISGPGTAR